MRQKQQLPCLAPPLILYGLFFFPDITEFARLFEGKQTYDPVIFSAKTALASLFLFYLPAIALCILTEKTLAPPAGIPRRAARQPVPRAAFFFAADTLIVFAVLVSLGAAVYAFAVSAQRSFPAAAVGLAESSVAALSAVGALLFLAAALEELFFRRCLTTAFTKAGFSPFCASLLSVLLFTLPHVWEGPFGMMNAFLAGLFLGAVYLQTRAIAPLALALGLYNGVSVFLG